jgi:hypothetical protein
MAFVGVHGALGIKSALLSKQAVLSLRGSCTGATHLEKELNFVVNDSFLFTRLCTTLSFSLVYVTVCF